MPDLTTIQIPNEFYDGLLLLLKLDTDSFNRLIQAVKDTRPTIYPGPFINDVVNNVGLHGTSEVASLIQAVLGLYSTRVRYDIDTDKLLRDIVESLKSRTKDNTTREDWSDFPNRLKILLDLEDSIGVTAKSYAVMSEHQRIFNNYEARVVSDIRPIFGNDTSKPPIAAVIIHNLKIAYTEGGQSSVFYVALDTRDLLELKTAIIRAEQKELRLRQAISSSNMLYVDPLPQRELDGSYVDGKSPSGPRVRRPRSAKKT